MEFTLSEEQNLLFNTAREFGEECIAPNVYDWEKNEEIPRDALKKAGDLGLGGMIVPEQEGEALRDDENFNFVSAWESQGDSKEPKLQKEKLEFETVTPTQRSYK